LARVLIVGCGCRGQELSRALAGRGFQVRGTTRRAEALAAIEAAGAEPVEADPLRLATLTAPIDGVSAVCWLMGSASGPADEVVALHDTRLRSLIELLVDTHARGFVYEAAGTVDPAVLARGCAIASNAASACAMPVAAVRIDPAGRRPWLEAMTRAVTEVHG
jgi:uncharacterized protein YbjT (DUF2867 family)